MQSKPYDVVLLPEAGLNENAIKLSKKLEPLGVRFTLSHETFVPHISLYMLQLNEIGLEKTLDLLGTIASETNTIQMIAHEYHYESEYLDVEYVKSPEIVALQEKVIEILNPIRDGLREKDKVRLTTTTGETLSNVMKYGYRSVGNLFSPHLTFTRFKTEQEKILNSLPPKETFNGNYPLLGIYEWGENGTCIKEVNTWKLQ